MQAGEGAGIYKMASSLGSAIGAALSLSIFTGLMGNDVMLLGIGSGLNTAFAKITW